MPSTTVHFPDDLLRSIDIFVKREGLSRNRFVIQACEEALKHNAGKWPEDFFHSDLTQQDKKILEKAAKEMESFIIKSRKNRTGSLL